MDVDEFVCRRNIEHYRKLLAAMQDGAERRLVLELLAAEEAKMAVMSVYEPEQRLRFRRAVTDIASD